MPLGGDVLFHSAHELPAISHRIPGVRSQAILTQAMGWVIKRRGWAAFCARMQLR